MHHIHVDLLPSVDPPSILKVIAHLHHHHHLDPFYMVMVQALIAWLHQHPFDCLVQSLISILIQANTLHLPRIEDHPRIHHLPPHPPHPVPHIQSNIITPPTAIVNNIKHHPKKQDMPPPWQVTPKCLHLHHQQHHPIS
ncbi:hypothetical protein K492DRAFT_22625 [Lichtheimia hyalospora FSU 10163]|nr:hypothetical protein K492DRAFT_22625 [Lichtheimia hyalospora FSU 10163]